MASSVSLLQLQLDSLPAAAADATTAATTAAAVAAAAASHGSDARRRTTSTGTGIRTVRRRLLVNSCSMYLRVSCHNSKFPRSKTLWRNILNAEASEVEQ